MDKFSLTNVAIVAIGLVGCRTGPGNNDGSSSVPVAGIGVRNDTSKYVDHCRVTFGDSDYDETFENLAPGISKETIFAVPRSRPQIRKSARLTWTFSSGDSAQHEIDVAKACGSSIEENDELLFCINADGSVTIERQHERR